MTSKTLDNSASLKRQAAAIVVQLPEEQEDALRVLAYARELIEWETKEAITARVLTLVG